MLKLNPERIAMFIASLKVFSSLDSKSRRHHVLLVSFLCTATLILHLLLSLRSNYPDSASASHERAPARERVHTPPVPTFKVRADLGAILEAENARSGVELGVQRGEFAHAILKQWTSCRKYVLVDLWAQQSNYNDDANRQDDEHVHYKQLALQRTHQFRSRTNIEVCHNFTTTCAEHYAALGEQFDFIYVDARHDYKGVLQDLNDWWPLLKPGGILAGHDYVTQDDGPRQTGQDWSINYDGTKDLSGRAVKGAVDDFALHRHLQLTVSYREKFWNTFATRKPLD